MKPIIADEEIKIGDVVYISRDLKKSYRVKKIKLKKNVLISGIALSKAKKRSKVAILVSGIYPLSGFYTTV